MVSLIFFVIFFIITIFCAFVAIKDIKKPLIATDRYGIMVSHVFARLAPIFVGAFTTLILAFFVTTVVPARTVGINIAFGKPVGTLNNGLHFIAPWSSVEKLDLAVQNDVYNSDRAIDVRLANSAKARVDASIQWQLKPEGAEQTYLDYRSFESIQSNLVDRNFRAALNEVLIDYDPLAVVRDGDSTDQKLAQLAKDTAAKMQEKVGNQIDVRSVTLPIVNFDDATQARIDELQTEFARTRIAEQKKNTSRAEAQANRELTESINPNVLTDKCLNIVRETKQSPLGCFPGSTATPVTSVK